VSRVRLVHVLSENWTLTPPRDLRALVRMAQEAEDAGFDAVMVSEHVVLGRGADSGGPMPNPRDYALPGNQDPAMPWPSSLVLLSAIAAATTTLRLAAAAIIAPLRHPLLLAKDLATLDLLAEGRLVVLPTVSWHEPEYRALGVPFAGRGEMLDEHLAAWQAAWGPSPASFAGRFYAFEDVWVEPKPWRADGVRLWFGSSTLHERLLRRMVRYGSGWNPLGGPGDEDVHRLREALAGAGRDPAGFELVGGTRGRFPDADSVADLDEALATIPAQVARGFTSICIKPSQFLDDPARHAAWCREVVAKVAAPSV
jgi:probable F420-dependent oxidoreductase